MIMSKLSDLQQTYDDLVQDYDSQRSQLFEAVHWLRTTMYMLTQCIEYVEDEDVNLEYMDSVDEFLKRMLKEGIA